MLRQGFIDPERTDDFPERFLHGASKAEIVRTLRNKGYTVGDELIINEHGTKRKTLSVTEVHRSGKIAEGFKARDGYNLHDADDWTPAQKAKLTRVYNQVKQLTERPYYVYRGRKKENIDRVQEATSPHGYPKEVKIAFVPVARPGERPEIRFTKTEVVIDDEPATIETVAIVERGLETVPIYWADVGVTREMLEKTPRAAVMKMHAAIGAKEYSPMAGTFQQPESYGPSALVREIRDIMYGYPERWPKFLLGVQAYSYTRQRDLAAYRTAREKAKLAQRRLRQKEKDAFRQKTKGRKQKK